jgi:hypothetical protein
MKKNKLKHGLIVTITRHDKPVSVKGWVREYNEETGYLRLSTFWGSREYNVKDITIERHPIETMFNKMYNFFK